MVLFAALPFAWLLYDNWCAPGLAAAIILMFLIGIWASHTHAQQLPDEDPSEIVIDEVTGMWLTLLVVPPDVVYYAIGFCLLPDSRYLETVARVMG